MPKTVAETGPRPLLTVGEHRWVRLHYTGLHYTGASAGPWELVRVSEQGFAAPYRTVLYLAGEEEPYTLSAVAVWGPVAAPPED